MSLLGFRVLWSITTISVRRRLSELSTLPDQRFFYHVERGRRWTRLIPDSSSVRFRACFCWLFFYVQHQAYCVFSLIFQVDFSVLLTMDEDYDVILDGDENEILEVGEVNIDPALKEDVWLLGKVLTRSRWLREPSGLS